MSNEGSTGTPSDDTCIGGWLLLWVINVFLLLLVGVFVFWLVPVQAVRAETSVLTIAAALYGVLFLLFTLFAMRKYFRRLRSARHLMIGVLIANVGFWAVCGTLWDLLVSKLTRSEDIEEFLVQSFGGALVACVIWIPYFLVSTRVKRTFVR